MKRLAFKTLLAAMFVAAFGLAYHVAAGQGEKPKAVDSILGVRVGAKIEEVHEKLKDLGTWGGRATQDGGRKEAWTLKETEFTSVAYKTNAAGRVVWITGFVRPGKEIPFDKLGDLARARGKDKTEAVWDVEAQGASYKLVAKGPDGKARVVTLISLEAPPIK
ncbi:MAG TPA: hypothetical protein VEX60_08905 [Pyrinomonadaceae bacterium]|nr:hypothetical protein [Pyrinomonadaceae bacterium]